MIRILGWWCVCAASLCSAWIVYNLVWRRKIDE